MIFNRRGFLGGLMGSVFAFFEYKKTVVGKELSKVSAADKKQSIEVNNLPYVKNYVESLFLEKNVSILEAHHTITSIPIFDFAGKFIRNAVVGKFHIVAKPLPDFVSAINLTDYRQLLLTPKMVQAGVVSKRQVVRLFPDCLEIDLFSNRIDWSGSYKLDKI